MSRAHRWFLTAVLAATLAAAHTPAAAQTRLYVLFGGAASVACTSADCEPGQLLELDVDQRAIVRTTFITHSRLDASSAGLTPDGRYVVWIGAETSFGVLGLSLFDTATATQVMAATLGVYSGIAAVLFVHPTEQRAFLHPNTGLRIAEPGALGPLVVVPGCNRLWPGTMSGDGRRLFARCVFFPQFGTEIIGTAVLDSSSGSLLTIVSDKDEQLSASTDGVTLFSAQATTGAPRYSRWDVATNSLMLERVVGSPGEFPRALATDPRTGRLWATLGDGAIDVLDPATLMSLARFPGGGTLAGGKPAQIAFDPDEPVAFVVSSERINVSNPVKFRSQIRVIDTDALVVRETAPLPFTSVVAGVAIAPRPPKPSSLSAIVSGRNVSFNWSLGTGAPGSSTFVDAGSAPGLANLASLTVAAGATSFTATAVPLGTYYVRVRTRTAGGVETTSNEVVVTVP